MNTNMSLKKADRAVDMTRAPAPVPLLMPGTLLWGILGGIQDGPEDLIQVRIAGIDSLVGVEVRARLEPHIGSLAVVGNICGEFRAGGLGSCTQ
jgi:hypothetical protein